MQDPRVKRLVARAVDGANLCLQQPIRLVTLVIKTGQTSGNNQVHPKDWSSGRFDIHLHQSFR